MQTWLYTQLGLSILLFRVQMKSHKIHFQTENVTKMKEFYVKELLHILFYNMTEMSEFYKSVKLGRFINKNSIRLCATIHII